MGFIGLTHDWATIARIERVVRGDGRRLQVERRSGGSGPDSAGSGGRVPTVDELDDDTSADACRADAFAARMLGELGEDGAITWDAEAPQVEVQVVMDLATLRGETDHPCLLDGMPVTADLGREIAGYAKAFRRMVTEPVTGHLLDYGRLVYLPEPLRTYTLARDGGCRAPGCPNRAMSRLQMDHADPFPEGPSDSANGGGLCTTCHQLKTAGYVDILDSRADGSCTWHTSWGQSVRIPPRSYLPGLDEPPPPDDVPQPPEPPPF